MSFYASESLLCIDVGNTHTVLGLFHDGSWACQWRLKTNPRMTMDEYGVFLGALLHSVGGSPLRAVAISSVVPAATQTLTRWAEACLGVEATVVGAEDAGLERIAYDDPGQLGTDRLANAVAAFERVQDAVIVVDCGTATKFEFVDARGTYLGGAIAPGLGIAGEALFARAARLYRVPLVPSPQVIGRNTVHALQAGLLYGHAALIDGMVRRMRRETAAPARVLATGGFASLLAPLCRTVDEVVESLTLDGIRLLFARRQEKKGQPGS